MRCEQVLGKFFYASCRSEEFERFIQLLPLAVGFAHLKNSKTVRDSYPGLDFTVMQKVRNVLVIQSLWGWGGGSAL